MVPAYRRLPERLIRTKINAPNCIPFHILFAERFFSARLLNVSVFRLWSRIRLKIIKTVQIPLLQKKFPSASKKRQQKKGKKKPFFLLSTYSTCRAYLISALRPNAENKMGTSRGASEHTAWGQRMHHVTSSAWLSAGVYQAHMMLSLT